MIMDGWEVCWQGLGAIYFKAQVAKLWPRFIPAPGQGKFIKSLSFPIEHGQVCALCEKEILYNIHGEFAGRIRFLLVPRRNDNFYLHCHAERSEASILQHTRLLIDPSFLRMTS